MRVILIVTPKPYGWTVADPSAHKVARQDGLVLDQAIGFIQIRSLHHAGDGWGVWAEDDIPATMLRDGKG